MERLRAVRTREYAGLQYTCRREPRPVAAAPSTCSPLANLRAPSFFPGQGRIGRFQWIIGLIPQVPGAVRHGPCIIRSNSSAGTLRAFLTAVFIKMCFAFLASERSSTIVIESLAFFHPP